MYRFIIHVRQSSARSSLEYIVRGTLVVQVFLEVRVDLVLASGKSPLLLVISVAKVMPLAARYEVKAQWIVGTVRAVVGLPDQLWRVARIASGLEGVHADAKEPMAPSQSLARQELSSG